MFKLADGLLTAARARRRRSFPKWKRLSSCGVSLVLLFGSCLILPEVEAIIQQLHF